MAAPACEVLMLAGLAATAACAASDPAAEAIEADRKLAGCLADAGHGDSLENVDRRRLEDPSFNDAVEECAEQLGIEIPAAGDTIRFLDEHAQAVTACLRGAGWDIPEPERGPHGALTLAGLFPAIPEDDHEALAADLDECSAQAHDAVEW